MPTDIVFVDYSEGRYSESVTGDVSGSVYTGKLSGEGSNHSSSDFSDFSPPKQINKTGPESETGQGFRSRSSAVREHHPKLALATNVIGKKLSDDSGVHDLRGYRQMSNPEIIPIVSPKWARQSSLFSELIKGTLPVVANELVRRTLPGLPTMVDFTEINFTKRKSETEINVTTENSAKTAIYPLDLPKASPEMKPLLKRATSSRKKSVPSIPNGEIKLNMQDLLKVQLKKKSVSKTSPKKIPSEIKLKVLYDFSGLDENGVEYDDALECKTTDFLIMIPDPDLNEGEDDNGWTKVRNSTTGEEGYVPSSYVEQTKQGSVSSVFSDSVY